MTSETRICIEAAGGVRRLRALARSMGLPPSADVELARLEAAVDAAADAVQARALESTRSQAEREQPALF